MNIIIIIIIQTIPCSNLHHYIHHMCRQWVCYATVLLAAKRPRSRLPLFLPLCSGTLQMWWHRWQQLAELVPSVNGVQQLYPAAVNIRAERGKEWPAPDINRGINTLRFNLFHLFLWGLDFAPLCLSQNTV